MRKIQYLKVVLKAGLTILLMTLLIYISYYYKQNISLIDFVFELVATYTVSNKIAEKKAKYSEGIKIGVIFVVLYISVLLIFKMLSLNWLEFYIIRFH